MTTTPDLPTTAPSAALADAYAAWYDYRTPSSAEDVAALVALLMTAPVRTALDTTDGRLIIDSAGWSRETGEAAKAAALEAGPDGSAEWSAAFVKALEAAPHSRVTMTSDGRFADRTRWCECPDVDGAEWVRYEAWSTEGGIDRRHGWVCPACRRLTQTG